MKKVLTVLLAIAVMFTFSFGSTIAFADSDDAKAYVAENESKYYDKIDSYAQAINFTYDEDGYLTKVDGSDVTHSGLLTKSFVDKALADAVEAAKTALNKEIGKIDYATTNTTALAIAALDTALDTAKAELTADEILNDWASLLEDQLDEDKTAAYALFATYSTSDYSANSDDWSKEVADSKYFDDGSKYEIKTLTGLTDGKYPAKTIVKGLLDTQNQVVTDATGTDADTYANAINVVRDAMTAVKDILNGHKIGEAPADYYVEAIPTTSDLKSDTSLADAKANAIAVVTAKLSSKQVEMADQLQKAIDVLDKKAKLDTDETKLLNKLKALKASLADDFANVKEVYTARINNAETTDEINKETTGLKDKLGDVVEGLTAEGATADGYVAATQDVLDDCADYVKWVKDLKADAEILKSLKNVNGVAYYDAEQINDNLEDVIEDIYDGKYDKYKDAYDDLAEGNDYALVDTKLTYTQIVTGEYTGSFAGIKDNDGNELKAAWNEADATRTPATDEKVGIMANGEDPDGYVANEASDEVAMYDDAQKAELEALVKETEAAIKAAKSISEVEKIFKDAHDKYVDIETTEDHYDAWASGKVKTAYNKADYETELKAYADYFVAKASASDYGTLDAAKIMTQVVYPIVYEAYTVDELAGKVAEAKAAIDAVKTKAEIKADKAAVEALIKALPATNAVALTDKDAIVAAADALDDYNDTYGSANNPVSNTAKLDQVKKAYEDLAADAIEDAYDALKAKTITIDDEAAIEALRDAFDAHEDFCDDYNVTSTLNGVDDELIGKLEKALSAAKVKNVRDLMAKLPANPTEADRAQVEAARAAYEALELDEQILIVGSPAYNAMIDAEEALGLNVGTAVKELKITAKSTAKKGSITVKWTVKGDATGIDGYEIWKSTKQSKGYKKAWTTTKQTYKNSKGLKKGTRYYYKVRAYKMVDGVKLTSDWSNKAYRKAK